MSNPFRISVPVSLTTASRPSGGRSLAEVSEEQQKEHRQQQRQRNNRYYKKKKKVKPGPPKPYDWANHIPVGGLQWAEEQASKISMMKYTTHLTDSMTEEEREDYRSCIPRMPSKPTAPKDALSPTEIAFRRGWERHEEPVTDQNGNIFRYNIFWTHPKYTPMRFASNVVEEEPMFCTGYTNWYGQQYEIPLATGNEDALGLAYNFEITASGTSRLVSNEWQSFWDTRRGRRHAKYLDYLERRKETLNNFSQQSKMATVY